MRVVASALACVCAVLLAAAGAGAQEQDLERAIRRPQRLTAGSTNELMGQMSEDGSRLFFVSDAAATLDLMVQDPVSSAPRPLGQGLGDTAWPRVSPDGKRIAYISFERDSTGDICVRPSKGGSEDCLTDASTAELQVFWWDSDNLGALIRDSLHGDFSLVRFSAKGGDKKVIAKTNMVGVAVSPDRKWLAYVPLKKEREGVGITFSNRTASGVRLLRVGGASEPQSYEPPLPGVTGFLAFSGDGRYLYFTQYLNDTNRSGSIDGDDNGVIFRVPFRGDNGHPLKEVEPQQLTSAQWDCHYPSPTKDYLVASCSHHGSLDIYRLASDGAVPNSWSSERIRGEIHAARDRWEQLLLYAHLLTHAKNSKELVEILRQMMAIHVELREYESALHYAARLDQMGRQPSEWARLMAELARHRRADLELVRGQPSRRYILSETDRAKDLALLRPQLDGDLQALAGLVISEIEDDIGDKAAALASFEAVDIATIGDPLVVPLVAERAQRVYGIRGDRGRLLTVYETLSAHQGVSMAERLRYARSFVAELLRGRTRDARIATVEGARKKVSAESELGLLLEVESILLSLTDSNEEDVREKLFDLYKKTRDPDRRRAVILSVIGAAAKEGNEYLQYQFVNTWASGLRYADPERKYAEQLYRDVVLDRAYGEQFQGQIGEARGYFYGTTVSAESLEGHAGFIEARIAEGHDDLESLYEKRFKRDPDSPVYSYVKAYLIARALPRVAKATAHDKQVEVALAHVMAAAKGKPQEAEIHQLWGYLLHQRSRRNGDRDAAVNANRQYLLALDLAGENQRIRAALLHQIGILQAALGNHRKALEYFELRERLPHVRPEGELSFRVAMARSAWHSGRKRVAIEQMERAEELVTQVADLAKYKPLVTDRNGLVSLSAGKFDSAQESYEELTKLLERAPDSPVDDRNRLKAEIGVAAAAIESGDGARALSALEAAEKILGSAKSLRAKPKTIVNKSLLHDYQLTQEEYLAIIFGLRYRAYRISEKWGLAAAALEARRDLVHKRFKLLDGDRELFELARIEHHLGEVAYRQGRKQEALAHIDKGLEYSAKYNKRTGSTVNEAGLRLLHAAVELHVYGDVALSAFKVNLVEELKAAYSFICEYPSPQWRDERFLFEYYLTILATPGRS